MNIMGKMNIFCAAALVTTSQYLLWKYKCESKLSPIAHTNMQYLSIFDNYRNYDKNVNYRIIIFAFA